MGGIDKPAWRRAWVGAALLGLFAAIGAATLAITEHLTRERIAERQRAYELNSLHAVLDAGSYDNDPVTDIVHVRDKELLGTDAPVAVHRARRDGRPVTAVLLPVAPNGYSGPIRFMVGIHADGTLSGVRVLAHRETPGLGDAIETEKSDWIGQFAGRSLGEREAWLVKRDGGPIDQLSGATITSRAVAEAVRNALAYFDAHRESLFAAPAEPRAP
ncbi:MAG TPA: electron transport complex subunit RsxG [Gammaproteobacteria bacterium]|nr:electron transport complex subunit RsxG [Gammaproteobacteria bacterium]